MFDYDGIAYFIMQSEENKQKVLALRNCSYPLDSILDDLKIKKEEFTSSDYEEIKNIFEK